MCVSPFFVVTSQQAHAFVMLVYVPCGVFSLCLTILHFPSACRRVCAGRQAERAAKTSMSAPSPSRYAVEAILQTRIDETTGEVLRLVKWVGFPESDNTWEVRVLKFCTLPP